MLLARGHKRPLRAAGLSSAKSGSRTSGVLRVGGQGGSSSAPLQICCKQGLSYLSARAGDSGGKTGGTGEAFGHAVCGFAALTHTADARATGKRADRRVLASPARADRRAVDLSACEVHLPITRLTGPTAPAALIEPTARQRSLAADAPGQYRSFARDPYRDFHVHVDQLGLQSHFQHSLRQRSSS